jgi:hypothetical protein
MSLFETKTADNFIYEEAIDPRESLSDKTPFLRKNMAYVVDQQAGNGSYSSGEVIIDSQSIAASGNFVDWRNGYLVVPFNVRWDLTFGAAPGSITGGTAASKFALAMKNCSLVDSLKVEANGKTIITATDGLASLINFKLHSTMTPASLAKDGAAIGYWPDEVGVVGDTGTDSYNAANDPLIGTFFADNVIQANMGLVKRQSNFLPTIQTAFMDNAQVREDGGIWESGAGVINNVTISQNPSDLHFVAVIRLRDLHDYFDKHSISRGVSYRITLRFNQSVSTISHPASTFWSNVTPAITTNQQTSGSTQPAMLCAGPNSMLSRLSWVNSVASTHVVTSRIDTTSDARISGVRLYVPTYEMNPVYQEKLLAETPIVKKKFLDFQTQTTQTFAGPGAAINVQVSTSCTNPKALIVIPRWSQTAVANGGQGFYSEHSPFSTVPGTTDGLLSLTNLQVKVGNSYILPDRISYGFQQFQDHVASIFAADGDQSVHTSGLIDKKMFDVNYRYYAFDLSRYPEALDNLPQMVAVECKNNSVVAVELRCILLYGRDAEFNLANGSLTITA